MNSIQGSSANGASKSHDDKPATRGRNPVRKVIKPKAAPRIQVVNDGAVLDIFAAALLSGELHGDFSNLAVSQYSALAHEWTRRHTDEFKDIDTAEKQQIVSLSDQERLDEKVLYDTAALGRLAMAVRVPPKVSGSIGGANKGAPGVATIPESQKALRERTGKSNSAIANAIKVFMHPEAVEKVIAGARAGGPRATVTQVLREINAGKPTGNSEPKGKSLNTRVTECTKTLHTVNGYMGGLIALWKGVDEPQRAALLKQIRIFFGHWQSISRKYGKIADLNAA
jgi:hypothetical protein